jgi:hypothetical protein
MSIIRKLRTADLGRPVSFRFARQPPTIVTYGVKDSEVTQSGFILQRSAGQRDVREGTLSWNANCILTARYRRNGQCCANDATAGDDDTTQIHRI